MYTAAGLRFLRTLATRGERVPAYLLPNDADPRGAAHHNKRQGPLRPAATGPARNLPR